MFTFLNSGIPVTWDNLLGVFPSKGSTQDVFLKVNGTSRNEQKMAIFNLSSEVYFLKVSTYFTEPIRITWQTLNPQSRQYGCIININSRSYSGPIL